MISIRTIAAALFLIGAAVQAQPPGIAWAVGGHAGTVLSIAQSYDGAYIASGGSDGLVKLWERRTGHVIRTYNEQKTALVSGDPSVTAVAFSRDGRYIASGGRGKLIIIWEVADGRVAGRYVQPSSVTRGIVFTPDGRRVVTGNSDGTLGYWDIDTGLVRMVQAHPTWVDQFAVSPDGATIATGSLQLDSIRLWDCATGRPAGAFRPSTSLGRIAFATNNLLVISYPDSVSIWNVGTGNVEHVWHPVGGGRVACSVSGDTVAVSGGDSIMLYTTATGAPIHSVARRHTVTGGVPQMEFLRDGTGMLVGSDWYFQAHDAVLRIYGLDGGDYTLDFIAATTAPASCAFTADARTVALTDGRGHVIGYDVESGSRTLNYRPRARAVSASVSAHAEYAVVDTAASIDATFSGYLLVRLADTSVRISPRTTGFTTAPAVAPDGSFFIVPGGIDFMFDVVNGTDTAFATNFGQFMFSRDGHLLVGFESVRYTAQIWEFPSLRLLDTLKLGFSFVHALSADGKFIGVALGNDTLKVWDVASGTVARKITGSWSGTRAMAFSEDARFVIAGGGDSLLRIFNTATGDIIYTYDDLPAIATSITVSPDGKWIAVGTDDPSLIMLRAPASMAAAVHEAHPSDPGVAFTMQPNPFTHATIIRFVLPERAETALAMYSTTGSRMAVPVRAVLDAGEHVVRFDASALPAGVYFVRLVAGTSARTIAVVRGE